jgi:phenylalanyl-tRNA synthetase beta chain
MSASFSAGNLLMKVSLNWLKEFVEIPVEPRRLKADLISVGLNVESYAASDGDCIFEIEVTTNRPDCLSHYGMAREVATLYRQRLKRLEFPLRESNNPAAAEASIEILNPELCARYSGRLRTGWRNAWKPSASGPSTTSPTLPITC